MSAANQHEANYELQCEQFRWKYTCPELVDPVAANQHVVGRNLTLIRLAVAADVDADVLSAPALCDHEPEHAGASRRIRLCDRAPALWTAFATPLTLVLTAALRQLLCSAGRQLQLISADEKQHLVRII